MDEQFEKKLNDSVQASAHPVSTSADEILSAYHAKAKEKKAHSYKAPFFGALGALACAVVALAILIPTSFQKANPGTSSSVNEDFSLSEIELSPLASDQDVLGYEIAALYPLTQEKASSQAAPLFANGSSAAFAKAVDSYETVQAPIRSTFLGQGESLSLESVSYTGTYGSYTSKLTIPEVGSLYFNATSLNGRWNVLTGELVSGSDVQRFEGAKRGTASGTSALGLKLYGSEEGNYSIVEQNESEGRFAFSFQLFSSYQLTSSFSLRLMKADNKYPFIIAKAFSASAYVTTTFKVLEADTDLYSIYGTGLGKISLSYKNSQRIYTNNGITITK
jgi:hypothetical protein